MVSVNKIATLLAITLVSIASTNAMISKGKIVKGSVEVICGPMFSGKTTELLSRLDEAELDQKTTLALKHAWDNRYDSTMITSHDKKKRTAIPVSDVMLEMARILELAKNADVVGIDEIQFFDDSILTLIDRLINDGKRVVVAGLDLTFKQEPFPIMPKLKVIAEEVDMLVATCEACGKDAEYSQRLIDGQPAHYNDPVVMVGADELYEPRCGACFVLPGKPEIIHQHCQESMSMLIQDCC